MKSEDWITTERVVNELRSVRDRRNEIYKKIIGYKFRTEVSFEDLYKKCFIFNCTKTNNDRTHVTKIFKYVLSECGVSWNDEITEETLDKFKRRSFRTITSIRVKFGGIITNLNDPVFYNRHVMPKIPTIANCKALQKYLRDQMEDSISHKGDIKILINAILHGYDLHQGVTFRSTDRFLINNTNKGIIQDAIDKFYPDHPGFEIKGLDDIAMQTTITNF